MKILIKGGAGYIGSHTIIEILETTDWEVISVDNYANSSEATYNRIKEITGKQFQYYNIDLKDIEQTKQIFAAHKDIAEIIHFATFKTVPESLAKSLTYYDNNFNSLISRILKS